MINAHIGDKKFRIEFSHSNHSTGTLNGNDFLLDIDVKNKRHFNVISNFKSYNVEVLKIDKESKTVEISLNGKTSVVSLSDKFDELLKSLGLDNQAAKKVAELKAPMPGLVIEINVTAGDTISKGDPILVLEAMKMENIIKSPTDGIIKKINIIKGVAVEKNQVLIMFE